MSVTKALDFLNEWTTARNCDIAANYTRNVTQPAEYYWREPAADSYKCNVDATIFSSNNKYGIAMSVRADTSEFYRAKTLWFFGSTHSTRSESNKTLASYPLA